MALTALARRRPLACYFGLAYLLSGVALAVIGPPRLHATAGRPVLSLLMFPVMVAGIGLAEIALTAMTGGRDRVSGLSGRELAVNARAILGMPDGACSKDRGVIGEG
jgi:hypothetical protein